MQADRSQVGFALMEPAFLRVISGQAALPPVQAASHAASWRKYVAGLWSALAPSPRR